MDRRPVGLHQQPPVGLLVVGGPDHPHLAFQPEQRRRERQGAAPLAGPGLGGQLGDALRLVVVRLRDGGVGLVRAGRAAALVLVVDPRRGAQVLLQPPGPEQRGGPPQPVDVQHRLRDRDVPFRRDLLLDQRHREQRGEGVRADRLVGARVQRRGRGRGQVGDDVVPLPGQLGFLQKIFDLVVHGYLRAPGRTMINANDTSRSSALVERLPAGRCAAGCGAGAAGPRARPQPVVATSRARFLRAN